MNKNTIVIVVSIVVIAIVALFLIPNTPGSTELDSFATCLADKGAVFYGAFWCPHCQNQKKMFGASARLLPYTECSLPDQSDQTPICKEKNVTNYPTWRFADGSELVGEISLDSLAEKTGCVLPTGSEAVAPAPVGTSSPAMNATSSPATI